MKSTLEQVGVVSRFVAYTFDLEQRLHSSGRSEVGVRIIKTLTSLVVLIVAAVAIIALWQAPFLLAVVLVLLAYVKHVLFPLKWELIWFLVIAGMGAYAESLIIRTGGAWTYANSQFGGIPIWLPAIWGLAATSLLTAYSAVTEGNWAQPPFLPQL